MKIVLDFNFFSHHKECPCAYNVRAQVFYTISEKFLNVKRDKNRTCHEMLHGKVQEQQLSFIEFSPSLKKRRELLKICVLNAPLFMAGRPMSGPTHRSFCIEKLGSRQEHSLCNHAFS